MSEPAPLAPLVAALRALSSWFEAEKVPHAIIGGVAASLLATPRLTRDIDAVVLLDNQFWEGFLSAGAAFGFQPRRADALDFARRARVLLLRHESSGITADISFGALPFERESIERAQLKDVGPGLSLRLASPEDLIIMKAVAHRGRDLVDIEELVRAYPALDRRRVLRWVRDFANVLESPEILKDLETLLARYKRS